MNNADCMNLVCHKIDIETTEVQSRRCMKMFADGVSSRLKPSAATLNALSNLREREYILGLLSNCSDEVTLLWDDSPLASTIQGPIFSCSVGMKKPDPNIFLFAAEKMNAKPWECIFVDDSLEYLVGDREAGMAGVLIQDKTLNSSYSNPDDWDGYAISSVKEIDTVLKDVE
ncbi:MAG TPA: HAD-IA family hydrolase [Dehalococcoidia bacterium]|nr:HAD-IA family hydrolase [Dehalococcoidia bacterium]